MALSPNRTDREFAKFDVDTEGKTVVRTTMSGTVEGSFAPSGLKIGGRISVISINASTWTKIPPIPLEDRNAISIQNYSGGEIKINYSDSVSGYTGVALPDRGERFYDITDSIELWAKSEAGTVLVTIEELA